MKRAATVACVALLLLALAALGALGWFHWEAHTVAKRMRAPELRLERKPAPDMQFQTLDGKPMHLSDARGKVVFLDLWGTWCVQCLAEMPSVQRLYDRYRNDPGVTFLVVSRMDSPERIRTFAANHPYTLPFYRMQDADIPPSMQFQQFPSTFLFDRYGMIVLEHAGAADWASPGVQRIIESLKAE